MQKVNIINLNIVNIYNIRCHYLLLIWSSIIVQKVSIFSNLIFLSIILFIPLTSKKLRGHIASGFSVCPSARPSIRPAFLPSVRSSRMPYLSFDISYMEPGRVAQSVGHPTHKSGVLGSIPGLATYFRFSFRFFKKGSCQLLAKVCARSTG